jgi:hypothetical protein
MMRGQALVFEQVLLFMISVAIFVACFAVFQLYHSHFNFVSMNDQVSAVLVVVHSHVTELLRFEPLNASVEFSLPERIGNELYRVRFRDGALNVTTSQTGVSGSVSLSGLEGYAFSGETASSKGKTVIYKRGRNIIIGSAS